MDNSIVDCAKLSTANTFTDNNTFSNTVKLNGATSVNSVCTFNGLSTDFNKQVEFKKICPLANTNPTLDDHLVNLFFFNLMSQEFIYIKQYLAPIVMYYFLFLKAHLI